MELLTDQGAYLMTVSLAESDLEINTNKTFFGERQMRKQDHTFPA